MAPAELTAAISPEPKPDVNVDDLRQVIASWTDAEVEQLHVILTKEIHRRSRLSVESVHVSPSAAQVKSAAGQAVRQRKCEVSVQEVAPGQVNAVRAARGAGMKLSRIAREFGLPLATIKRILDVSAPP
jgi:LysM repeat protein